MVSLKAIILGSDHELWWSFWYLIDWLVVVTLLIVSGLISLATPYDRYLPLNDPSVTYPVQADIIPDWLLIVLAVIVPMLVLFIFQLCLRNRHDFHHALLSLAAAHALNLIVTAALKVIAGRYRPDYIGRIGQNDARQSFPSGHASTSFAGLIFLCLYLFGKSKVYSEHSAVGLLKGLGSFSPFFVCTFIAISRTMDYHHNFDDILAGAVLGTAFAFIGYFLYFPSLFDSKCDLPRTKRELIMEKTLSSSPSYTVEIHE